jgi:two-component system, cell cycle response regulator
MDGTFLIASKNRATLAAIQKALKAEQHQVHVATDGLALVDLALDLKPGAIFLGIALDGLNALDAARALRALGPTADVPIIFLAENAEEAKKVADARVPLTECLTAPFVYADIQARATAGWHLGKHVAQVRVAKPENEWMLAILDPLTRLFHRRYLLHQLGYEAKRSARYKNPLSVLLVDVDNLREINRQYGILTGDSVLIETGQFLLQMLRKSEIVGRNDVQDFLILAPQTDETGARTLAARICQSISEHHFVLEKLDLHVTVSVGAASAGGEDLTENLSLLGRAEVALSRAKRAGKNRIEGG